MADVDAVILTAAVLQQWPLPRVDGDKWKDRIAHDRATDAENMLGGRREGVAGCVARRPPQVVVAVHQVLLSIRIGQLDPV